MVNYLISFPGQQTRCIQLDGGFLDGNKNQGADSMACRTYGTEQNDYRAYSMARMYESSLYSLISALYGISMDQFYLIINGRYANGTRMNERRVNVTHMGGNSPNNGHCSLDKPIGTSVSNSCFRQVTYNAGDEQLYLDEGLLYNGYSEAPITVTVKFRILGGKGGFGAILKSQAGKKKQSTNIDSCRNLQGQRIRTARLTAQMKTWENKQELSEEVTKLPKKPREVPEQVVNTQINTQKIVKKEIKKMKKQVQIGVQEGEKKKAKEEDTDKILETCLDIYGL